MDLHRLLLLQRHHGAKTIELYAEEMGVVQQKDFTLAEVYSADEAFITGTLGGITPIAAVDGRTIGDGGTGPVTRAINDSYLRRIGVV